MSPFLSWRPLVGSLLALTSAEMAALMCIAAARIGFLLAALHSIAKRIRRRPAYHPTQPVTARSSRCAKRRESMSVAIVARFEPGDLPHPWGTCLAGYRTG